MTNTYLATNSKEFAKSASGLPPQSNESQVDSQANPHLRQAINMLAEKIAYDLECQANWQRMQNELYFPTEVESKEGL
jgi:hypothetical protein